MNTGVPAAVNRRLFRANSPDQAWDGAMQPWFEAVRLTAWQHALPSAVLVPTRTHANALKAKLLASSYSQLGLHFFTPTGFATVLNAAADQRVWPHLRLLLAATAERFSTADTTDREALAVVRTPDALLATLDRLEAAGWDFEDLRYPTVEPLVTHFRETIGACGFALPAAVDRRLAENAGTQPPDIANLLIAGFDGAHWPRWFLLQAAVQSAQQVTVVLQEPRDEARELDETWIGTWEELYGPAEFVAPRSVGNETLFPELFEPELFRAGTETRSVEKHFLVGRDVTEQARAIVALIKTFLASGSAERIGVLFPEVGALPRTVAALLAASQIPHFDGIGHLTPGPLEHDAWPKWLELQDTPRLRGLLAFLRSSPAACQLFGLPADEIERILGRAARNLLLDELSVLRGYCGSGHDAQTARIVAGLNAIGLLPERAAFADFLARTLDIFRSLGWQERSSHLEEASAGWSVRFDEQFSRTTYLRWLSEISTSVLPHRDKHGDHPYSRVQLLFPAQAEQQTWSHLIFAGLNEGAWPGRPNDSGFVQESDIARFNGRIKTLNRRALRQGRQGEGHAIVAPGKTFYLGPAELRTIVERQFRNLCESATVAIAASASLIEERAPERFANPSEFFTELYLEAYGEAPGQKVMSALAGRTAQWLTGREKSSAAPADSDVEQTAVAYRARRTPEIAFGEYEFGLREPLDRELVLSATDCERVIKGPALVWLRKFLGVEAREDELANWNIAIGQWVHDWLRQVAPSEGDFVGRPPTKDVRARVHRAAHSFRDETAALLGRRLPDWWMSAWNQAVFIADALAETITTTEAWSHFATEWTLAPVSIAVSENEELRVRGRIDLLLAREATDHATFPFRETWIVDYKTGRRTTLAPGRKSIDRAADDFRIKLLEGKGVQLAIYALALHALGAQEVGASLLTRDLDLEKPQVCFPVIEGQREIWRDFARLSRSGVFGMRGALRAEFGFQQDYPLASLGFDPDFLEEKWNATHPALPKIEKR